MRELKSFENGFEYVEIKNETASAKIALQGAHIFHYERKDEEPMLWLSSESDFETDKAIRGGVPICWPSFGMNDPSLPQHGFARVSQFKLIDIQEIDSGTTKVHLQLQDSKESRELWDHRFCLDMIITVSDKLNMELITKNMDDKEFKITQALHTYFQISNISNITVKGLSGKTYLDAVTNKGHIQNGDIVFDKETDRVYQEVDGKIVLQDIRRSINIKNEGSSSVVVWNPWIEKCKRMSAMSDEAYKEFVCIESANAFEDFKVLKPQESHTLKAVIH